MSVSPEDEPPSDEPEDDAEDEAEDEAATYARHTASESSCTARMARSRLLSFLFVNQF